MTDSALPAQEQSITGSYLECEKVVTEEEKSRVLPEASRGVVHLLRGGVSGCKVYIDLMCNAQWPGPRGTSKHTYSTDCTIMQTGSSDTWLLYNILSLTSPVLIDTPLALRWSRPHCCWPAMRVTGAAGDCSLDNRADSADEGHNRKPQRSRIQMPGTSERPENFTDPATSEP